MQWQPTPVLWPGKSYGQWSLVGCSPWGRCELDTTERLHFQFSLFTFIHWRRKWHPTPVFLPGESQGWGSLVGRRLWGHTESDTTEVTQQLDSGKCLASLNRDQLSPHQMGHLQECICKGNYCGVMLSKKIAQEQRQSNNSSPWPTLTGKPRYASSMHRGHRIWPVNVH